MKAEVHIVEHCGTSRFTPPPKPKKARANLLHTKVELGTVYETFVNGFTVTSKGRKRSRAVYHGQSSTNGKTRSVVKSVSATERQVDAISNRIERSDIQRNSRRAKRNARLG